MADFGVSINVTRQFFDRKAVTLLVGKDDARALSRIGSFVRRRARSSLRRRKRPSMPGETPSVHSRDAIATLKFILFAYDPARQSVVIGPVRLNVHSATRAGFGPGGGNVFTKGAVPGILEHGGLIGVRKVRGKDGQWTRAPFGQRRRTETLVPVWKATPEQRSASLGVHTIRKGKRTLNFYRVPIQATEPSRIIWTNIAPRPFMGPALSAEAHNFPSLFVSNSAGAAA